MNEIVATLRKDIQRVLADRRARIAALAALAAVVAVAVLALLFLGSGGGGERRAIGPWVVTADELRELARDAGHEVYWVGERPSTPVFEFERTEDGLIFVRYLARGGTASVGLLTVGTYPVGNAAPGLKEVARRRASVGRDLSGGGVVVRNPAPTAKNAYVAYPGSDQQVEVFSPRRGLAARLAITGRVVPIR